MSRSRSTTGVALDVFGEALFTFGVLCALYLVYVLWWTNVTAGIENRAASSRFQQRLAATPAGATPSGTLADGTSFGFLYIPALGAGMYRKPKEVPSATTRIRPPRCPGTPPGTSPSPATGTATA